MPAEAAHLRKAEKNKKFIDSIDCAEFPEWFCTGAFYCALHYIESALAKRGIHSLTHDDRDKNISGHAVLSEVYGRYNTLRSTSELARYNESKFGDSRLPLGGQFNEGQLKAAILGILSKIVECVQRCR